MSAILQDGRIARLTIAVPCFGPSPKWTRMLLVWIEHYLASGCRLPVVVITDLDTPIPELPEGMMIKRSDPEAFPGVIRPGMPFDLHGALICDALASLGPCVVMDSDALMLRDPTEAFARFPHSATMGMAQDAGQRPIRVIEGTMIERNGGVLHFGAMPEPERHHLLYEYRNTFVELMERYATNPILEQLVWSVVWYRLKAEGKAHEIPSYLNHSHLWGIRDGVIIRHEHGSVKWHRLAGGVAAHAQ